MTKKFCDICEKPALEDPNDGLKITCDSKTKSGFQFGLVAVVLSFDVDQKRTFDICATCRVELVRKLWMSVAPPGQNLPLPKGVHIDSKTEVAVPS